VACGGGIGDDLAMVAVVMLVVVAMVAMVLMGVVVVIFGVFIGIVVYIVCRKKKPPGWSLWLSLVWVVITWVVVDMDMVFVQRQQQHRRCHDAAGWL